MSGPLIVAEIGASHNGNLERAIKTVDAAKQAGADAIKLQCYSANTMVANQDHTINGGAWHGQNLCEMYRKASMPRHWHETLFAVAKSHHMLAFSTPFDETAVAYLQTLDCPIYKIASHEITDLRLISTVAATKRPILISTGMASVDEIARAIKAARGCSKITLLKCTSAYPASLKDMNLLTIPNMRTIFEVPIGLSDHTDNPTSAVVATALGATVIERHITLERADGPDDGVASTPDEFSKMVLAVRDATQAMGKVTYGPTEAEEPSLALRRGLYANQDLHPGDQVSYTNVKAFRPASEIDADMFPGLIGARIATTVKAGSALIWDNIDRETIS